MECPNCHKPVRDDQSFCPTCGMDLREARGGAPWGPLPKVDMPQASRQAGVPTSCPQCRAALSVNAKFCDVCGASVSSAPAPPKHCSQCGAPLKARARFCNQCGSAVAQAPPAPPPQSQPVAPPAPTVRAMRAPAASPPPAQPAAPVPAPQPAPSAQSEIVLGVIPGGARSKALGLKREAFFVVVTSHRLIFAHQTGQMMKENARRAKEQARQQGKGFFGQWGAVLGSGGGDHYLGMPPQAILNERSNNFFLMNNQVQSVRIRHDHDQETGQTTYQIEFKAASGKTRLRYQHLDVGRAKQLLQQVLGKVVR